MRNDESVRNGVAKTANVFARAAVVEEIGLFPQELISGGDVHWTRAATDAGFELVYAPEAVVTHSSRQLWELLRKQYRVGTGQIQIWRMDDRFAVWILLVGLACFPFKVLKFLLADESGKVAKESPPDRDVEKGFQVIVVAGLCILLMSAGRLVGLFGAVNSSH